MSKPLYYLRLDIQCTGNPLKPCEEKFLVSSKAGYLFMNRAAVDEEDQSEILKIFELEKKLLGYPGYLDFKRRHKGRIF